MSFIKIGGKILFICDKVMKKRVIITGQSYTDRPVNINTDRRSPIVCKIRFVLWLLYDNIIYDRFIHTFIEKSITQEQMSIPG